MPLAALAPAAPFLASAGLSLLDRFTRKDPQITNTNQVTPASWEQILGQMVNPGQDYTSLVGDFTSFSGDNPTSIGSWLQNTLMSDIKGTMNVGRDQNNAIRGAWADIQREAADSTGSYDREALAARDDYLAKIREAETPAFQLGVGGQQFGVVPKRNAMLADMADAVRRSRLEYAGGKREGESMLSDLGFQSKMALSPQEMGLTNVKALWPYIMELQKMRFGLPSNTTTETGQYTPSLTEELGSFAKNSSTFQDLFDAMNLNQPVDPLSSMYSRYPDDFFGMSR